MSPVHRIPRGLVLVVAVWLATAGSVQADTLVLTLTDPVQSGAPGDLISLSGTVANTGEQLINLNGNTIFFLGNPNIFTNFSIEPAGRSPLPAMSSIGPAPLVSFIIAPDAPRGTFTYGFTINGLNLSSEREESNRVAFTVAVRPIPEPATMLLLGTGLTALGAAVRRRRRVTATNEVCGTSAKGRA